METDEFTKRWRYLRDLLIDQLSRFESGVLRLHTGAADVSSEAILKLKQNILEFDALIAGREPRNH